ncbi:MAG: PilN domain-containing protein [Candidatus Nanopelagicales bacterium]|nr:PilN domain-containing protein [Candidatus Nanopelagicales bacterium]
MTTYYNDPTPSDPPSAETEPVVRVATMDGLAGLLPKKSFPVPELIPPSVMRRRAVDMAKRRTAIAIVLVLVLVAAMSLFGRIELRTAQNELSSVQASLTVAEAEKAKYRDVPVVYAAVDAARAELAQAMGTEVLVARLITDLGFIIPPNVSLTSVSILVGGESETPSAGTTATEPAIPPVGTVAFSGEARAFTDVSAWIDTLRSQPDYANVILTDVSRDSEAGTYTFSNTAELTDQALSGRYVEETE